MGSVPDVSLRAFVVWERVIPTDIFPPSDRVLALARDDRTAQYWDRMRLLSKAIVSAMQRDPELLSPEDGPVDEDTIAWDVVAVFPPGARWEEGAFPEPAMHAYPIVSHVDALEAHLGGQRD